jgi:hypothetical protein
MIFLIILHDHTKLFIVHSIYIVKLYHLFYQFFVSSIIQENLSLIAQMIVYLVILAILLKIYSISNELNYHLNLYRYQIY